MVSTKLGNFEELYYQLDILQNDEDLEYYANKVINSDSNFSFWFMEGLYYYTYIKAEKAEKNSIENKRKSTLKDIMTTLGINTRELKMDKGEMKDIVHLCIESKHSNKDIIKCIMESKIDDEVKENAIGFIKAGLDPIGYYSSDDIVNEGTDVPWNFFNTVVYLQKKLPELVFTLVFIGFATGMIPELYNKGIPYVCSSIENIFNIEDKNEPMLSDNVLQGIEEKAKAGTLTNEDISNINNEYALKQLLRKYHSTEAIEIAKNNNSKELNTLEQLYKVEEGMLISASNSIYKENERISKILNQ